MGLRFVAVRIVRIDSRYVAENYVVCYETYQPMLSVVAIYAVFVYDWGDHEHVFMPVSSLVP